VKVNNMRQEHNESQRTTKEARIYIDDGWCSNG